jgi:hypothetical protein
MTYFLFLYRENGWAFLSGAMAYARAQAARNIRLIGKVEVKRNHGERFRAIA